MPRRNSLLLALLLAFLVPTLLVVLQPQYAYAQAFDELDPGDQAGSQPPDPAPSANAIGDAVGGAVWRAFEQSLPGALMRGAAWLFSHVSDGIIGSTVNSGVGRSSLIWGIPEYASYGFEPVRAAHALVRGVCLSLWLLLSGTAVIWAGLRLLLGYSIAGELALIPLFALSLWGIHQSGELVRTLILAANGAADALRVGVDELPAWSRVSGFDQGVARGVAAFLYIPIVWFLFGVRAFALALVNIGYILSPLGIVCAVLPFTRRWFAWWFGITVGACLVVVPQALALSLGVSIVSLASRLSAGSPIVEAILGFCMILVAIKLPSMMPGAPGAPSLGMFGKQMARRVTDFALDKTAPGARQTMRVANTVRNVTHAGAIRGPLYPAGGGWANTRSLPAPQRRALPAPSR